MGCLLSPQYAVPDVAYCYAQRGSGSLHQGIVDAGMARRLQFLQQLEADRSQNEQNRRRFPASRIGHCEKQSGDGVGRRPVHVHACEGRGPKIDRGNGDEENKGEKQPGCNAQRCRCDHAATLAGQMAE
jgi:hypothetical protein